MRFDRAHTPIVAGLLALVFACGDSGPAEPTPGEQRPESALAILRLAADAPPLFNPVVSFWAHRGTSGKAEIFFRNPQGGPGEKFAELDLDDESLLAYPDGRPFVDGDSVLITIRATDPGRILFEFEPSGLRFNPAEPAELEIRYARADGDYDGDGDEDRDDERIEQVLGIWRQAVSGGPFVRLGTLRFEDLQELEAKLLGFSRFAIAY